MSSHVFPDTLLSAYQKPHMGTPAWFAIMDAHNRVEGSYGVAKSLAVLNWGRQFHHLVGVAREALIASLVVMAYNFHIIRTWQRRQDLAAGVATAPMFDPQVLVDALIALELAELGPAPAPATETPTHRPPKGLPMLGPPDPPG